MNRKMLTGAFPGQHVLPGKGALPGNLETPRSHCDARRYNPATSFRGVPHWRVASIYCGSNLVIVLSFVVPETNLQDPD